MEKVCSLYTDAQKKNTVYSSDRSVTALPVVRFKFNSEVEGVDEAGGCQSCHRPPALLSVSSSFLSSLLPHVQSFIMAGVPPPSPLHLLT